MSIWQRLFGRQTTMSEPTSDLTSGPIPETLDVRLERRDTSALPEGALLRFQLINRGKHPGVNYLWLLYEDGRWLLARHSGDSSDWQTPLDTPLPTTPTKTLPTRVVQQVKKQLAQADFFRQAAYQEDKSVRDGAYSVVTARQNGQTHEVIYAAATNPLITFLQGIAQEHG
jgi:hypothetical protein